MKKFFHYYREAVIGLAIAPFSGFLWNGFIEHAVDVVMTLLTFCVLMFCIATYPLSCAVFALIQLQADRRKAKSDGERILNMARDIRSFSDYDKVEFLNENPEWLNKEIKFANRHEYAPTEHVEVCDKAVPGWQCSRLKDHDGPCAAYKMEEPLYQTGYVKVKPK